MTRPSTRFQALLLTLLIGVAGGFYSDCAALAQSATAVLTGVVVDENGALIPGVEITLLDKGKAFARQVVTGEDGGFTFLLLTPGGYVIRAQRDGFTPVEIGNVAINAGDQRAIRIRLRVGGVGDAVSINETVSVLESAASGAVINRRFIENLPTNGGGLQTLIALAPGVVLTRATAIEQGQFSANGQRANANYFTVDGVSASTNVNPNLGLGQAGALPGLGATGATNSLVSIESLQELRIQTAVYAPEFGRMAGAQVSLVTRSGTERFHGSLFDYFRNDALDANDWFANRDGLKKAALRQNNFGGALGGPVCLVQCGEKDQAFFFFTYEGLRLRQPLAGVVAVPSLAARRNAPAEIQPIVNAYPLPNGKELGNGLAQFSASYSDPTDLDAASFRFDHNPGEKQTWFVRYAAAPSSAAQRVNSLSQRSLTRFDHRSLTGGLTRIFDGKIGNDLRANFTRSAGGNENRIDDFGGATAPADAAIFPPSASAKDGSVAFLLSGGQSFVAGKTADNTLRQINLVDHLSINAGAHQFKFGVDYRRLLLTNEPRLYDQVVNFNGVAGPAGFPAPIGTLLSGRASSIQVSAREALTLAFTNLSAYAQDAWRITPRLTVTYGFRWEFNPPPAGKGGKELFTLTGLDELATSAPAARGSALWRARLHNFAPRVGLAYRLSQRPRLGTVLRGGFGVFYDLGLGLIAEDAAYFPYFRTRSVFSPFGVPYPLDPAVATPPPLSLDPPYGLIGVFDPRLASPRTYQWSATVEQPLGADQTLAVAYAGAAGRRLPRREFVYDLNGDFRDGLLITRNAAESDYHALQVQFQRRLARGLQALASHTWSHSIDNASNDSSLHTPAEELDPRLDRGASDFDVRHSLAAALSYDLPAPKSGLIAGIFQDWSVDAILRFHTARPVNVTYQRDIGFGFYNFRPDLVTGVPVYAGDPSSPGHRRINHALVSIPGNPYPQIGAFRPPVEARQGTLERNALRGFSFWQLDAAARRQFKLNEKLRLQLRAEFFNLLNHPNFADPRATLTDALFGVPTTMLNRGLGAAGAGGGLNPVYQVGGPRSIQLALKLTF